MLLNQWSGIGAGGIVIGKKFDKKKSAELVQYVMSLITEK